MSRPHPLTVDWIALDHRGVARQIHEALCAWRAGTANEAQQRIAWDAVQHVFCGIDDLSWRDDDQGGDRMANALEGRRSVALQLRRATSHSYGDLTTARKAADSSLKIVIGDK